MNRARSALLCYRIVSAGLSPVCLRVVSCSLHDGLAECWLKPQDSDLLDKLIQLWSWWKTSICISNILKSAVPLYPFRGAQAAGPLAVGDAPQQAPARSVPRLASLVLMRRRPFPCLAVALCWSFLLAPAPRLRPQILSTEEVKFI